MALFKYTAQTSAGDTYERTLEAPDRFSVYTHIRKEGGTVIEVTEEGAGSLLSRINETVATFTGRVKEEEKIVFARNLGTMIKAGLPLSRALQALERQTKNPKFKKVLQNLNSDITKGIALHEAMGKFPGVFSALFVSMVKAGEESGRVVESLEVVARQMDRAQNLKKKIRSALIYPTIVVIAMIGIGILMLIYVVPTLTQTFGELGVDLPRSTQVVIAVSNFMTTHTVLFFGLLVGVGLVGMWGFRTQRGQRMFEFVLIHMPIISKLVKEVNSARTTRTLSSLLSSGVEIVRALSITREVVQNSYYKEVISHAEEVIQKGGALAEVFAQNEHLYPVMVGEMIAVGGETGKLTSMLEQIADFYENEVEQQTKDLSTVIEPFLMLFIGAVVGFFAVSMISPIYSISSGI